MALNGRLLGWVGFIAAQTALAYGGRAAGDEPDRNAVYTWGLFIGGVVSYAIIAVIILAISVGLSRRRAFALRRPRSWPAAVGLAVLVFIAVSIVGAIVTTTLGNPGDEQGLTPTRWRPERSEQFAANFAVIALVAPIVEELTFRGIGFSLLARYGAPAAIVAVGIAFGLVHGLVEGLPVLVAFGIGLAWLRSRTDSVFPAMFLHAAFNALALSVSVTT